MCHCTERCLKMSPQKFRRVRKEDAGEYYCQAKNDAGHAQCPPQMMEVCEWRLYAYAVLELTAKFWGNFWDETNMTSSCWFRFMWTVLGPHSRLKMVYLVTTSGQLSHGRIQNYQWFIHPVSKKRGSARAYLKTTSMPCICSISHFKKHCTSSQRLPLEGSRQTTKLAQPASKQSPEKARNIPAGQVSFEPRTGEAPALNTKKPRMLICRWDWINRWWYRELWMIRFRLFIL